VKRDLVIVLVLLVVLGLCSSRTKKGRRARPQRDITHAAQFDLLGPVFNLNRKMLPSDSQFGCEVNPQFVWDGMRKGISTHLFVEEPLTVEHLELVRARGFDSVEIFALKPHFNYEDKKTTSALASWLSDHGALLQSIHTPFCRDYQAKDSREWLSIAESDKLRREKAVDEIRRALEFAEKTSLPLAVVHLGAPGDQRPVV
jgi:Xylose isomerase-like TIM barrel